jgi:hypothetical protein
LEVYVSNLEEIKAEEENLFALDQPAVEEMSKEQPVVSDREVEDLLVRERLMNDAVLKWSGGWRCLLAMELTRGRPTRKHNLGRRTAHKDKRKRETNSGVRSQPEMQWTRSPWFSVGEGGRGGEGLQRAAELCETHRSAISDLRSGGASCAL